MSLVIKFVPLVYENWLHKQQNVSYIFYAVLLYRKTSIKNHGDKNISESHTDKCDRQISALKHRNICSWTQLNVNWDNPLSNKEQNALIEQCLTSPPTQYRLYGRQFLQVKRPNQQYQSTEGESCKGKQHKKHKENRKYTHKKVYK